MIAIKGVLDLVLLATVSTTEADYVYGRMSGVTRYLYENLPNYDMAGFATFILVFLLSAIVYKLGFAKKLSLGKNIIIYIFLFLGCIILTFLALFLPMVEGLIVIALVLILYKIRLSGEKREERKATKEA
jgi:hypothetical protein